MGLCSSGLLEASDNRDCLRAKGFCSRRTSKGSFSLFSKIEEVLRIDFLMMEGFIE